MSTGTTGEVGSTGNGGVVERGEPEIGEVERTDDRGEPDPERGDLAECFLPLAKGTEDEELEGIRV